MKTEIKYGLLAGAGVSLWVTLEYLLGLHTTHLAIGEYSGYFSTAIPAAFLWHLLRRRQTELGPLFTLRRGLWPGLLVSFVSAMVIYCFFVLYNHVIHPGWLDHAMQWKVDRLRAAGVAESEIRTQLEFYRNANSPVGLLLTTLVGTTLTGGLISLLFTFWFIWRGQRAS